MKFRIWVPGKPVGKQRPRKGRGNRWYTPRETKEYEARVGELARMALPRGWIRTGRYQVVVDVSTQSRRLDLDNVLKSVLDGLTGTVYEDDRQVDVVSCKREWRGTEGVEVSVVVAPDARPVDSVRRPPLRGSRARVRTKGSSPATGAKHPARQPTSPTEEE